MNPGPGSGPTPLGTVGPRGRAVAAAFVVAVVVLATVAGPVAAGQYVTVRAPDEATAGEPVTVTVVVTVPDVPGRNGSSDGTVNLAVDGERAHSRTVTATDGETLRVPFDHTFEEPGEYTLTGRAETTVEGTTYSDSDRTTIEVVERSDGGGDDAGDDDSGDGSDGGDGSGDDDAGDDDAGGDDSGNDADAERPAHPLAGTPRALAPSFDPAAFPGVGPVRALTAHPLAIDATGDGRVTLADVLLGLARAD